MAIQDETIDATILELARTMKALQALKKVRKQPGKPWTHGSHSGVTLPIEVREHAAVKRASMDLSRVLADLRQGR